jgi:hypothetical protein
MGPLAGEEGEEEEREGAEGERERGRGPALSGPRWGGECGVESLARHYVPPSNGADTE